MTQGIALVELGLWTRTALSNIHFQFMSRVLLPVGPLPNLNPFLSHLFFMWDRNVAFQTAIQSICKMSLKHWVYFRWGCICPPLLLLLFLCFYCQPSPHFPGSTVNIQTMTWNPLNAAFTHGLLKRMGHVREECWASEGRGLCRS